MGKFFEIRKLDGAITNIIVWDGIANFGQNLSTHEYVDFMDAPQNANRQWTFLNGEWIAPPPSEEVTE